VLSKRNFEEMVYKIYFSYDNRSNSKYIVSRNFYKKLISNGYHILNDFNEKTVESQIEAKIKECDFFLWCVTNEYIASNLFMKHLKLAKQYNKQIIQLLMSDNIDSSLLPDEIDLDKQEIVEVPNNSNAYFEIIHTIGKINSKNETGSFDSILKINFERTFQLKDFENLSKIFDTNENEIIGIDSNPFRIHVFNKETLEFEKTAISSKDIFVVSDVCKLNGFDENILVIGSNSQSNQSFIYVINSKTYEIISRKCLIDNYNSKGLQSTKAKKKFLNSCAENIKKKQIYILDNFQKANILVFSYKLQLLKEFSLEIPNEYSNIFMRKLAINNNTDSILLTNAINNCIHVFDLNTLGYKNVFACTLDMNFRALYMDNYNNLMTLSWNNPCNGFNVFDIKGNHIVSFNLPYENEKNRLFHPSQAIFLNSNKMLILDGNYTSLLHLYSIEYC
jgi:hypothetical protein